MRRFFSSKWFSNILAIVAIIISIGNYIFPSYEYRNSNKEDIEVYSTTNSPCIVLLPKIDGISDEISFKNFFYEYLSTNKSIVDYNIKICQEVITNIYNHSSVAVAIIDCSAFSTNVKSDLDKIKEYETIAREYHNLVPSNNQKYKELRNFYLNKRCELENIYMKSYGDFGYTLAAGDMTYNWERISLIIDSELENYIKNYIREHQAEYAFIQHSDDQNNENYYINNDFQMIVKDAINSFCTERNEEITYTYRVRTSKNNYATSNILLALPNRSE